MRGTGVFWHSRRPSATRDLLNSLAFCGAGGGGRTLTTRRSRDFESRASASFTTPARPGVPLKYTARPQTALEGARFRERQAPQVPWPVPGRDAHLPEQVIDALSEIDRDLSRVVVRLAQPQLARKPHAPAELATFGRSAVIVVNPTRTLEDRTGVRC